MPLDAQHQAMADAKAAAGGFGIADLDVAGARGAMLELRSRLHSDAAVAEVVDTKTANRGVAVRVYRPLDPTPRLPPVVYLHGGGFVLGDLDDFDPFCRELSARAGAAVVSVGYALAPEAPFPAAIEDAWDAVQWAADEVSTDGRLVLVGDSAGGGLAAICARRDRDAGTQMIVAHVLAYPLLSHRLDRDSHSALGTQYSTTTADLAWFWGHYIADPAQRAVPDASPLVVESLAGLPQCFVLLAKYDPLVDEGREYVDRLRASGVSALVEVDDGAMHGFLTAVGDVDAAIRGLDQVAAYLRGIASN